MANPTTERTSPCCSNRLPCQKTHPHSSRVEHYSPGLSTSCASLFRRSSATLPRTTHLGSRNRLKIRSPQHTPWKNLLAHGKNLFAHGSRTRRTKEIRHRAHPKRLHSSFQKPLRRSLLFHQEEGWKTQTRPRLPTPKPMDGSKYIPTPANSPTYKQSSHQGSVH